MPKQILKASVFTAFLLLSPCLGDLGETMEVAPGQQVGWTMNLGEDTDSDLSIKVPAEISDWMLDPTTSPARKEINLSVNARIGWKVSASLDVQDGRMAQYGLSMSQYVADGKRLQNPLKISTPGNEDHPSPWEVALAPGGTIQEGEETGGQDQKVTATLEQAVSWNDEPLPEDQAYHAVLKFTISPLD